MTLAIRLISELRKQQIPTVVSLNWKLQDISIKATKVKQDNNSYTVSRSLLYIRRNNMDGLVEVAASWMARVTGWFGP